MKKSKMVDKKIVLLPTIYRRIIARCIMIAQQYATNFHKLLETRTSFNE